VDLVVVALDVVEINRVAETRCLEKVACIRPEHGRLTELGSIALTVAVIDGIEAGEGREQPDVGLGDGVADEVTPVTEAFRQPVESGEEAVAGNS